MSGASPGPDVVNIMLGFIVFMLVLVELHGFSTVGAIFAIPVVIFSGMLMFISYLLAALLGFFIGAATGSIFGLLFLAVALIWLRKSLVGFTAQNYMLFAIFLVLMLLLV